MSQHTKLTLEKKILPPLLPGFELETFRSRVRRFNQQAIPAPRRNRTSYTSTLMTTPHPDHLEEDTMRVNGGRSNRTPDTSKVRPTPRLDHLQERRCKSTQVGTILGCVCITSTLRTTPCQDHLKEETGKLTHLIAMIFG